MNRELLYCEHNRRSTLTLYTRERTYTCAKNERSNFGKDAVWGWGEPCVAECYERGEMKIIGKGSDRHWGYPDGYFPYKRIKFKDIPKDKAALRQEKEERAGRKKEAKELRDRACNLIAQAKELEK